MMSGAKFRGVLPQGLKRSAKKLESAFFAERFEITVAQCPLNPMLDQHDAQIMAQIGEIPISQ